MAKKYYLRFLIDGHEEDLVFHVRKKESDRLGSTLAKHGGERDTEFFWFGTVDGKSVAVNLAYVQGVRFLWDPAESPPDLTRTEDCIRIMLRGKAQPLEEYTESPDQLYDFFTDLEHGPETVAFPKFDDEDGEPLQLNAREIVWVTAPTQLLDEGAAIVAKEDGLEDDA